jgi:hypothetical protein
MTTETLTRSCANPACGRDISHLSKLTRFCRPCAYDKHRKATSESARRLRGTSKVVEPSSTVKREYCSHYFANEKRILFEDDDGTKHFVCMPCWKALLED